MLGDVLLGIVSLCTLVSYLPQAIKLIKVLNGVGITVIESMAITENIETYKSFCFFVEDIFNIVVKSSIVIIASITEKGIAIILIKF